MALRDNTAPKILISWICLTLLIRGGFTQRCDHGIYTPFTKTSPNYPHKNNADNLLNKNCVHKLSTPENNPHFIYECPLKKKPWKDGWACGEGVTFDRALEIVRIILELRSQIRSLVPMRLLCG